jgi:integration host factor subunit beta
MNKSEIIQNIIFRSSNLRSADLDKAVKLLLDLMGSALAGGGRVELRGFGSFSLHTRKPRAARNPKTGESITQPSKRVPHFRPGKGLRVRVDQARGNTLIQD